MAKTSKPKVASPSSGKKRPLAQLHAELAKIQTRLNKLQGEVLKGDVHPDDHSPLDTSRLQTLRQAADFATRHIPKDDRPLLAAAAEAAENADTAHADEDLAEFLASLDRPMPPLQGPPDLRTKARFSAPLIKPANRELAKLQEPYSPIMGEDLALRHCPDLIGARRRLVAEFPYATAIVDHLLRPSLRQQSLGRTGVVIEPTLIYGAPGLGKSRFARRVCEELGVHHRIISVAGMSDDQIFGLSRGWSSAFASVMTEAVLESQSPNPVMVLDEIEKTCRDNRNGSITQKLLALLEPSEACHWREPLLACPVDMSHIGWIMTANSLGGIPSPLRSRLSCLEMRPPDARHLPAIIRALRDDLAGEEGLDPRWYPSLDAEELEAVTASYEHHRTVRILRRQVRHILESRHSVVH
jgi:hypothetical protein